MQDTKRIEKKEGEQMVSKEEMILEIQMMLKDQVGKGLTQTMKRNREGMILIVLENMVIGEIGKKIIVIIDTIINKEKVNTQTQT